MNTETTNVAQSSTDAARDLLNFVKTFVPNDLAASVIVFVVLALITAFITHLVTKALRRFLSRENSPLPQGTIFINIWRVCGWAIGLSIALSVCFGFDVSGAVTALGVGGIALSLGLQDTISNLIGGLQMSLMGTVVPGDHVEIGGRKGVVRDITWRQLTMETSNRQTVVVPNSTINNGTLVKLPPIEKIIVPVNFYKNYEDLDATIEQICAESKEPIERHAPITQEPFVQLTSVSEYSYTGCFIVWVNMDDLEYAVRDDIADEIVRVVARLSPSV